MTDRAEDRYRFGDYELDTATRQLKAAGKPLTLQPRVFDLLAFLIEQRGRAVNKDEIQAAVWAPMIVSETALTRAIMKARRAVGDDAESQAVIRTVHGHGYQFVAPLQDESEPAAADPKATASASADQPSSNKLRWLLVAAAAVIAVGIGLLLRSPDTAEGVRVAVLPIDNETGDAELDWVKFGLMGLANDLFIDATDLKIVSASDVVRFTESTNRDGQQQDQSATDDLELLRRSYGATHILLSRLEKNVGGLRLSYTLVGPDGRENDNTMVSDKAPPLVRGMVRSVSTLLGSERRLATHNLEIVDEDPFINEAYARGTSFALEGRCAEALPLFEVTRTRGAPLHRAHYEWAECTRVLGRWQEAEEAYAALIEALDAETSSSLLAEAHRGIGTVYHRTGRLAEAATSYQQAYDEAQRTGDKVAQGKVLISMAILAKDRRNFTEARELLARSSLTFRELEWEVLPGEIFSTLANIAMNDGKLNEAEQHLDNALNSFRQIGDRRREAMMLNNYGFLRRSQGRFDEAEPLHLQSLAIRRDIGDRIGQGRILGMLSILYERDGRLGEAKEAAAEAVAISREANDRLFLATGLAQLGTAEQGLSNVTAARSAFDESRANFVAIDDHSRAAQVELRLARLDMEANDLAAADARIQSVLVSALENDYPEPAIEAMDYAGDIAVLRNDPALATRYFERALEHIDETGFEGKKTDIAVKLAHLYLDAGEVAQTEALLGFIVEQDDSPATLKLMARYAFLNGDRARSIELMETAKTLAEGSWSSTDADTLASYQQ